jgi:hypothetical protein
VSSVTASSSGAFAWSRLVPAPGESVRLWHIGPFVDPVAYHWSWLFAFLPVALIGGPPEAWWPIFLAVLAVNFGHRVLTLPYVYLDTEVFRSNPLKFLVLPGILMALFVAGPFLESAGSVGKNVFGAFAGFAAAWNVWHVLMQKYGILRLYAAKSEVPVESRAPGWVDRLLVFAWMPLLPFLLAPHIREPVHRFFRSGRSFMPDVIDALEAARPVALPVGVGFVAFALVLWLRAEWRASRLRNPARLGMAAGLTALNACFLFFDPVKVYLGWGATHAIEYTTFVWAFQRKRYRTPLPHRPLIQRLLRFPWFYYGFFLFGLGGVYVVLKYWERTFFPGTPPPTLFGFSAWRWIASFAVFQSMMHFWFDGFLWKMRVESTRNMVA